MIPSVFLFYIFFQLLDNVGHLLLISTLFRLELPNQPINLIILLLLQQLKLHLVSFALDLQIEELILFNSDQFMQSFLLIEALLNLSLFVDKLSLEISNFLI